MKRAAAQVAGTRRARDRRGRARERRLHLRSTRHVPSSRLSLDPRVLRKVPMEALLALDHTGVLRGRTSRRCTTRLDRGPTRATVRGRFRRAQDRIAPAPARAHRNGTGILVEHDVPRETAGLRALSPGPWDPVILGPVVALPSPFLARPTLQILFTPSLPCDEPRSHLSAREPWREVADDEAHPIQGGP
jgi:hypothetical protein